MSTIKFKYLGQRFKLDLKKGKLSGDAATTQELIDLVDAAAQKYPSIGGEPWMPFDSIDVTDPYKHADQFAMCLFYALKDNNNFPDELSQYLVYPDDDMTGLSDDDLKIMKELSDNIVY